MAIQQLVFSVEIFGRNFYQLKIINIKIQMTNNKIRPKLYEPPTQNIIIQ